jgi:hypothetical protein
MTVPIYPIDEVSDIIAQTVETLEDSVDWVIVRNPVKIPTTKLSQIVLKHIYNQHTTRLVLVRNMVPADHLPSADQRGGTNHIALFRAQNRESSTLEPSNSARGLTNEADAFGMGAARRHKPAARGNGWALPRLSKGAIKPHHPLIAGNGVIQQSDAESATRSSQSIRL